MSSQHPLSPDPLEFTRQPDADRAVDERPRRLGRIVSRRVARWLTGVGLVLLLLIVAALVGARIWVRHAMIASLPQIDGSLVVPGLQAPVFVERDAHGVPTIRASSMDDLVFAQGYVTAQDRLFQMDTLRRHAAGELAEILGPGLLEHDRSQRTLQLRATADRALGQLPPDQRHWLEVYARGVNVAEDGFHGRLPIEFRLLRYEPKPWSARDSMLVALVMFEDLTNTFPEKLNREAITARLATDAAPELRAQLLLDLYPVGSWRDHPPNQAMPDLSAPVDEIPEIPLDDSQVKLRRPAEPVMSRPADLLALQQSLAPSACAECWPGSNNWAVSGARTVSGKPLLSNDMHLAISVPSIWYEANLEASTGGEPFHVAGVTLPGAPFVIVGHNQHVAWGFTNLGADVQDLYVEHLRGSGEAAEFEAADGTWHPVQHHRELIHVRGGADQELDVLATEHGSATTPIISGMVGSEPRPISLRWVIYDPGNLTNPFFDINAAKDAASLVRAFGGFGGPSQNMVYADDAGHIGYHATGRIPLRGSATQPSAIPSVPVDAVGADALTHEWMGYIPYEQLPQVVDPPGGLLATANARITPDGYPFPITNNWADPYRNERLWKLLATRQHLAPTDMLAIEGDIYSDPDRVIAHRLAYAIDHAELHAGAKRLHAAADLLRTWNGKVASDSAPAAIVDAARAALWPLLLTPKLGGATASDGAKKTKAAKEPEPWQLYVWGERAFAEEQLVVHTPARWLPPGYATWDDLLAAAVDKGLTDAHAPSNLAKWKYGNAHPLAISHPLFSQSALVSRLMGVSPGIHSQSQSGNGTTVKQVGHSFGPSERFTADLGDPERSTMNIVLGQSGNPASPWYADQFPAWLHVTTFPLPFGGNALMPSSHRLTLNPR